MNHEDKPYGHRKDPLKQPRRPLWRDRLDHGVGTFLTGMLFLLPFIITLMILDWLIRQLVAFFGAESLLGSAISGSSALIFGEQSFGIWLLLAMLIAAIWGVGRLFQTRAKKSMQERIDSWVDRIPLIGGIYRPISRITRMIGLRDENELAAMRPVAIRMGGHGGADVLGLMPSAEPVFIGEEERVLVYMPSAPIPMTGFLTLVAKENVLEVEGLAVDDLLKFYISVGTIVPDELRKAAKLKNPAA